jgi:RNA polymerase sigma-70 factor, ECF subfamily
MDATRQSLLLRAQAGDEGAWDDLVELYRPLIVGWLHRQSIHCADRDDLVQEILMAVVQGLAKFQHSGRLGAFRAWLKTIARNYCYDYWKSSAPRVATIGEGAAANALGLLDDPESDLNQYWDQEHDRYVLRCLLEMMELEFESATVRAFRRVALENATATEAASELGLSVASVYAARSRVLRRLREVAKGFLDDLW